MPCATAGQVCLAGGTCVAKTQVAQPVPYMPNAPDAGGDGPRDAGSGLDTGGRDARENPAQWVAVSPALPSPTATLNGVWPIDNANVFVHNARYVFGDLNTWGWFLVALGVLQFFAALAIWRGEAASAWPAVFR